MRMGEGVEWSVHCCLLLGWAGDRPLPTARLAAAHGLSAAYLNKHLQALARAGLVESTPGPRGGFRLTRPPAQITLMDVVSAIEGPDDAFRCTEIRQAGVGRTAPQESFAAPCAVSTAMRGAEMAWRRALAAQSLEDVMSLVEKNHPGTAEDMRTWFGAGTR